MLRGFTAPTTLLWRTACSLLAILLSALQQLKVGRAKLCWSKAAGHCSGNQTTGWQQLKNTSLSLAAV